MHQREKKHKLLRVEHRVPDLVVCFRYVSRIEGKQLKNKKKTLNLWLVYDYGSLVLEHLIQS